MSPSVIFAAAVYTLVWVRGGLPGLMPNDPLFSRQLSLSHAGGEVVIDHFSFRRSPDTLAMTEGIHLNVLPAWRVTTGSRSVTIAILDDGFLYQHEDLKENTWQNPGEVGLDARGQPRSSNGVDDDGNGYVDDVVGWDFVFEALVHGSGFRCIMVVNPRARVATDELSQAEPVQVREIALPDSQLA